MFTSLLLAGMCLWQPDFGAFGSEACTIANQSVECRCSECIKWDDPQDIAPLVLVRYYDIERTNPNGSFTIVGGTWRTDWIDEDGVSLTTPAVTIWCPAKDSTIPQEGQLYGYRIRACNLNGCGGWSNGTEYMAAPYAVNQFQPPIVGNP